MKRILLFLVLSLASSVWAAAGKLVRVAFYPSPGWCEIDSEGKRKGYVPDWVAEISSRCSWKVQWVQCRWDDALELLKKGDIDVVVGVSYDTRRARTCLYPQVPFALFPTYLFVHRQDARFGQNRIGALDQCKIGLVRNYQHNDILIKYLTRKGISKCAYRFYQTDTALAQAFAAGEVDAALNDIDKIYAETQAVPLLALPRLPLFAVASPRRPELVREIDYATVRVLEESPEFTKRMREENRPYKLASEPLINAVNDPDLGAAMFELLQTAHPEFRDTQSVMDNMRLGNLLAVGLASCVVLLILVGAYLFWLLRAAKAGLQMRSNFLALMNHEIRTPLNAVMGSAEFLRQPGLTQGQVLGYANQIQTSSKDLMRFLDDVLDLSKLQAGNMEVFDGQVDCPRLFREMESFYFPQAQKKGVILSLNAKGVPVLGLRESCLRQILMNLIGNAIKFTEKGDILCRMTSVEDGHDTATLVLMVRDTGCGIAEEKMKNLYDPFAQQEAIVRDRSTQGVGLGLSIVYRLVAAAGGTLDIRTEVGTGTAIVVRIPNLRIVK